MFDRDRFGTFALVGNISLFLLLWRQLEVCLWFYALYQGNVPSDLPTALIILASSFLTLPHVGGIPFGAMTVEDLKRMLVLSRCIDMANILVWPHAAIIMVLNYDPHLAYIKYIVSPLLLAGPVLCGWYHMTRDIVVLRPPPRPRVHYVQPLSTSAAAA